MNDSVAWSEATRDKLLAALLEHAPTGPHAEPHLHAVITGVATQPGKLVRARLVLATTAAHGIDERIGLALATAVEYFHISSLLLDDLPCMDDAQTRRGQPCAHRVHGEATAILAALAFINRAYTLVGLCTAGEPAPVRLQVQACLDACLGSAGLVGGQARDLRFATSDRSVREVCRVAGAKTSAMLWLGLLVPALLTGPDLEEVRALEALCIYWGLAFQAVDDLNDVTATSVDAGKTTGRDRQLARPNLAIALGVPGTRRRIARLLAQANRKVRRLTATSPAWSYLVEFQHYFADSGASLSGKSAGIAA
ncbi:MAG: polyprenyl synthetase family protein [Opitutaceae bacterium]|nr:polyprenyl synthetase family protein [Opitutaceae bacterium]